MTSPAGFLPGVCSKVAEFLDARIAETQTPIKVLIGNPKDAAQGTSPTAHHINLFFYSIAPSGFSPETPPDQPWRMRLNCLITAFGIKEDNIESGLNDLRLIGEVTRIFHETPVLPVWEIQHGKDKKDKVQLQVVYQPLSLEEINHLWATQGDVAYRPSVAYEFALVPIFPAQRGADSRLVGEIGVEVRAGMNASGAGFDGDTRSSRVPKVHIDIGDPRWVPRICFVHRHSEGSAPSVTEALRFPVSDPNLPLLKPRVWVAGDPEDEVDLVWELWTPEGGWIPQASSVSTYPLSTEMNSDNPPETDALPAIDLPGGLIADDQGNEGGRSRQAVVYASRTYRLAGDPPSRQRSIRSNPLLLTVYDEQDE